MKQSRSANRKDAQRAGIIPGPFLFGAARKLMAPPMFDAVPSLLQLVGMAELARSVGPFAHVVYQRGGSATNPFGNAVGALRT